MKHLNQIILVRGEHLLAPERAIGAYADVMAADTGLELARDRQVALRRVEVGLDRAILRLHDQAGIGIGIIGGHGAAARAAVPHSRDVRPEGGGRGGEVIAGEGLRIDRVGGRVEGVEMHLAHRQAALGGDVPVAMIAFIIDRDIAELHVATIGQVAALGLDRAQGIAITDADIAQRGRVQRAGEIVDIAVQADRRIARIVGRDRQIEDIVVVGILPRQLEEAVR